MNNLLRTILAIGFIFNIAHADSNPLITSASTPVTESEHQPTWHSRLEIEAVSTNPHNSDAEITEQMFLNMIASMQVEIKELREANAIQVEVSELEEANMLAVMGDGAGNGGGAWICESKSQIHWMQLIDLFEVRAIPANVLDFGDKTQQEIYQSQLNRLSDINKMLFDDLRPYFVKYHSNEIMVDAAIMYIDDAPRVIVPETRNTCLDGSVRYVQIANYTDENDILINKYLYNHSRFSPTDRAALVFHEVIYSYLRDKFQDDTSVRARKITGLLFSDIDNQEIYQEINDIVDLRFDEFPEVSASFTIPAGSATPHFVTIPHGSFVMGEEKNKREVTISKDFEIMTTEVTQLQWYLMMKDEAPYAIANPSYYTAPSFCDSYTIIDGQEMCPNNPVEYVDMQTVKLFIAKLNEMAGEELYRLPTEAEWEYAARGKTSTRYFFGNDNSELSKYAWHKDTCISDIPFDSCHNESRYRVTHPVAQKQPNQYGLYDVYGNVAELVADWYTENPRGGFDPIQDRKKSDTMNQYVTRGGAIGDGNWLSSSSRSSRQDGFLDTGFRLVKIVNKN